MDGVERVCCRPPNPYDATADDGKLGTKLYHAVNMVVLAGVPAAITTSPSALTMPLDLVLGIALPLHAHIGMNYGELFTLLRIFFLSLPLLCHTLVFPRVPQVFGTITAVTRAHLWRQRPRPRGIAFRCSVFLPEFGWAWKGVLCVRTLHWHVRICVWFGEVHMYILNPGGTPNRGRCTFWA